MALTGLGLSVALAALGLGYVHPVAHLPRPAGTVLSRVEAQPSASGRRVENITLEDARLGAISLAVDFPDPLPPRPLPVVFVLGGLESSQGSIHLAGAAGDNILVGYAWPLPRRWPEGLGWLREAPAIRSGALRVPGQVSAALAWVAQQPWADRQRLSLIGVSLGAIAGPAVQRVADLEGISFGWTVLGYGGADLSTVVAGHPRVKQSGFGFWAGALAGLLLQPMDPAHHLPELPGRFLLIRGREDSLISVEAAKRMYSLAPAPKSEVLLEGNHPGVGRQQKLLLTNLVRIAREWLVAEGAVNPP